jgi:monofunctional biosynthetic peptidoglycan transglycosylase
MTNGPPEAATPGRRRWPWIASAAAAAGMVAWLLYQVASWPQVAPLSQQNPQTTAFIERYRQSQREQGHSGAVRWEWAPYERISPHLKRAVVSAEDMEFFFHHGFSSAELKNALTRALRRFQAPRGASTITQQLAKNLWLSPSRDPFRKLKEAVLTWQLERHLTKRRILELYLNVVELGPGIYGAEAAAEYYFGKPAADLTEHEAAELAASLPRPAAWHPGRDSDSYRAYVAEVERRMGVATFLWRALGAAPPVAAPPVAALPEPDSTLVVGAARDALIAAYPTQAMFDLTVAGLVRDSAGFVVDLVPAPTGDTAAATGGAVVRVGKDGIATIVRLHQ